MRSLEAHMNFPNVVGSNLERKRFNIPQDLEGNLNFVIIAFQRWHQRLVDEWIPFLLNITERYPNINFYEFPTISNGYKWIRFFIDGGMRAGISDKSARERTITLYLSKRNFREQLEIKNEKTIHLFLIDKSGKILWRASGGFDMEKLKELQPILMDYENPE